MVLSLCIKILDFKLFISHQGIIEFMISCCYKLPLDSYFLNLFQAGGRSSVYSGTCLEMGKARYFRPKFTSCTITRDVFLHLHALCWPFRELYYILYPGTTINHMNFFFPIKPRGLVSARMFHQNHQRIPNGMQVQSFNSLCCSNGYYCK